MNFRTHSTLYFATGIVFIAIETLGATWPEIIVKALIIPMLIRLYAGQVRGNWNPFHRLIIIALVFSWGGDVLLQLSRFDEMFFLIGVGSFLVTQLIYMCIFFATPGPNTIFFRKAYLLLPVAAYGVFILWLIYDGLGEMLIPILVYAVVILTMLVAALNREKKVSRQSYILVVAGAALFIISDSLIMINRVRFPFELARIVIMSAYITAQYLIAFGCLRQFMPKTR